MIDDLELRIKESSDFFSFAFGTGLNEAKKNHIFTKRCSKCLLNELYTNIDSSGLCNHCKQEIPQNSFNNKELKEQLHNILQNYQGKGVNNYDAIVMYSGGKDSAYLLSELQSRYPKLRLLALFIDSGFASKVAHKNIDYTFSKVDVTYNCVRPKKSLFQDLFRYCLLNFNQYGGYETVDRSDGDCLFDIAKNFAYRNKIPLILSGLSKVQCEDILGLNSFEIPEESLRQKRLTIAKYNLSDIYNFVDYNYWWDGSNKDFIPRVIFPFYSWDYDEDKIRSFVKEKKLLPEQLVDPIVTNHTVIPIILALDYLKLGYCTFEPEFSKLVRDGLADRNQWLPVFEALEYLAPKGLFMPESIRKTLAQLELTCTNIGLPISVDFNSKKLVANS
jgi:hypothetical protein